MSRFQSPAIVLRRWPYSETSLSAHLLTPELGVVAVLAKGVHRPTSGSLGVLDTWALVEAEFGGRSAHEMQNLYGARLLQRFAGLSADPDRLIAAAVIAELAELAAPPGAASDAAYAYLLRRLQELDAGADPEVFLAEALLEGLDLLGIGPILDPEEPGARWFCPAMGGTLPAAAPRPLQHARRASGETLDWLRRVRGGAVAEAAPPPRGRVDEALTILGEFAAYHLERPPRAWDLLRARRQRRGRPR